MEMVLDQYPMFVNISLNGDKILLKDRGGKSFDLYISDTDNIATMEKIDSSEFTQFSLTWHPNNREVFFQEFNPTSKMYELVKINTETKKRVLIDLPPSANAIPPLRWSEEGRYLAYLSTIRYSTLYIYDYYQKKVVYTFSNIDPYSDFQWGEDSTFYYVSNPRMPILSKINIECGKKEEYSLLENGEVSGDYSIKRDKVLFIGRAEYEEFFQCYELDVLKREIKRVTFSDFNVSSCDYKEVGNEFYYNQNENGINKLYSSDSLTNRYLHNIFNDKRSLEINLQLSKYLYVTNHSLDSPHNLIRINLKEKGNINLVYAPHVNKYPCSTIPSFVKIKNVNSTYEVPGYLWKASPDNKKTIIYIHGGPYIQIRPLWHIMPNIFNFNGFNFLAINYHGSSGYSKSYAEENNHLNQIQDIVASVNFLKENYGINQQDIVLVGSSYGGQLVLGAIDYLEDIGGVVLISGLINNINETEKFKKVSLLGFYGEYDPLSKIAKSYFRLHELNDNKKKHFILLSSEGHFFQRSSSWSNVYQKIIESY